MYKYFVVIMTIIHNRLKNDTYLNFAHVKLPKFAGFQFFPAFGNFAGINVWVKLNTCRGSNDILVPLNKSQRTPLMPHHGHHFVLYGKFM